MASIATLVIFNKTIFILQVMVKLGCDLGRAFLVTDKLLLRERASHWVSKHRTSRLKTKTMGDVAVTKSIFDIQSELVC